MYAIRSYYGADEGAGICDIAGRGRIHVGCHRRGELPEDLVVEVVADGYLEEPVRLYGDAEEPRGILGHRAERGGTGQVGDAADIVEAEALLGQAPGEALQSLAHLDDMAVRVVEAGDELAPRLLSGAVDELDPGRRQALGDPGRVVVLEIERNNFV